MIITIDGPAGAGKSTVAKAIAHALGIPHLDSGAYYRMATLACLDDGVDLDDTEAILACLNTAHLTRHDGRAFLNGVDVEGPIRGETVTALVYKLASNQVIRDWLLEPMREELASQGGVIDGRDAATVIAPEADVRIWLTADVAERALRRAREQGEEERLAFYLADVQRRDDVDAKQMVRHPQAQIVDTTGCPLEMVIAKIMAIAQAKDALEA